MFTPDISAAKNTSSLATALDTDTGLDEVLAWFSAQPDLEERFGSVLRQSIDEVLDGQRTGRFDLNELAKTEKTYLGTKVEIVARAAFGLGTGQHMDYLIAGHEVDAKFTMLKNWTIPGEADEHICLLIKADDEASTFQVGLIRIQDGLMNSGRNRDGKRTLSRVGRSAIRWIIPAGRLPANILMSLSQADRLAIFNPPGSSRRGNGGQQRVNELFRRASERRVDRNTVLTVASQDDGPKRVRDSRKHLSGEGILILGHQNQHPHIARSLGVPIPDKGSWVSVRVTDLGASADSDRPTAQIAGSHYAVWAEGDPVTPAPASY
ncbi:NaeI family type II restriction endonuclease [Streptomyces sp. NPDC001889]